MFTAHYQSPLGEILLAADEVGLTGLWFDRAKYYAAGLAPQSTERETPPLTEAKRWLDVYFSGKMPDFMPPLHPIGSDFRQEVWALLLQIPYGKTAKSILISCGARLAPFDIAELRDLMAYDEMELEQLGEERTAMFVIISDTDDTFNFVVSIMYTQLFNLLCDRADDEHGGHLPCHVRLLLDEFANIGLIPKFDKLIATIRSREISASIILQSQSQLKTIYKDAAETIIGNCDTMLFLGGKESSTLKEISETLGKETIDLYNTSDTRGQSPSFGTTYQKTGKELMSRDELSVMDGNKCILQLRGVRPFLSDKFDITKHKRYKELSDFDKKNAFDVERYLKHELRLRMDEEFDCYEVDVFEESTA